MTDYDVVIVGGSIAGCTAATFFGRRGAKVALIESHSDPTKYKTACTHFIQASATPTIERLGLAERIESAGGIRNGLQIWSRYGWIRPQPDSSYPFPHYGYSIRREKLDPMIRALASETPGVELMLGTTARDVVTTAGRPVGVRVERADGSSDEIRARLVVGADGRNSRVAALAGVPGRVKPNNRFVYFAYYRDLPLVTGNTMQMWLLDPQVRYAFPNDDGVTLLAAFSTKDTLGSFKRDMEGEFERLWAGLPLAPEVSKGERISKLIGKLDMPNVHRPAARPGIAFIGDAALAADPLWGVGCGWAFQSAEWLVEETGDAITGAGDLDAALERYRKRHRRSLLGHFLVTSDFSTGRRLNPLERLIFSAATRDERLALRTHAFGSRSIGPEKFLSPATVARAVRVNATA